MTVQDSHSERTGRRKRGVASLLLLAVVVTTGCATPSKGPQAAWKFGPSNRPGNHAAANAYTATTNRDGRGLVATTLPSQAATPYKLGQPTAGRYSVAQLSAWNTTTSGSQRSDPSSARGRTATPC